MSSAVKDYPGRSYMVRLSLMGGLLCALPVCFGCALMEVRSQSSLIGSLGVAQGTIECATEQNGPIVVVRFRETNGLFSLDGMTQADSHGAYKFTLIPGTYYIAAFIDSNNDGIYQPGEAWNHHGKPSGITVESGQTVTVEPLIIAGTPPALLNSVKVEKNLPLPIANIGRVAHLDDPIMTRDNYSMGMWRPVDFLVQIGGGLLFLQTFEKGKIPVIFVHGINGGPTDLKGLVESLERDRFQPWVLYYPTGLRLDMVSDYLVTAVASMQSRHGFTRFAVVSHSMGGLVTRSFVKKYVERYPDRLDNLVLVMTINSPMGGMPSAAYGVNAPVMIQSWRDLAPGSDFLEGITAWSWPPAIPYYLIVSYTSGKDGDGVVPMESQAPLKLQQEAVRMFGIQDSHAGTLTSERFLRLFTTLMSAIK